VSFSGRTLLMAAVSGSDDKTPKVLQWLLQRSHTTPHDRHGTQSCLGGGSCLCPPVMHGPTSYEGPDVGLSMT
jgi:hypothetical protein